MQPLITDRRSWNKGILHYVEHLFLFAFVGLTAWGGVIFTHLMGNTASIWLPNGAILAYLLTREKKLWWQYLLAGFLGNFVGDVFSDETVLSAIEFSLLNACEIFVAAFLLRLSLTTNPDFEQPKAFFNFCILAVFTIPLLTALLASLYLYFSINEEPINVWPQWFFSDSLGVAIVTPLFLGFLSRDIFPLFSKEKRLHTLLGFVASILVIGAVFYQTTYPFLFFIPPVLIAVAAAQGIYSVALYLPFLAFIGLYATIIGHGPLALARNSILSEKIILAQLFFLINFALLYFVANLASERRRVVQRLAQLALIDGLTGIANRRSFDETLSKECRRAWREKKPVSLLLLDIDNFKAFNDIYGHPEGDRCITRLAQNLSKFAHRPGDLTARYGGEELAVILTGCGEIDARKIAEHVRRSIEELGIPHKGNKANSDKVTTSIGVSTFNPTISANENAPQILIDHADKALYEAKRTGRNKVVSLETIDTDIDPNAGIDEEHRLSVVQQYIQNAPKYSDELNKIAYLAASLLKTPIGVVSIVGRNEQVFVGRYGLEDAGSSRDASLCAHTFNGEMPLIINDATQDKRFENNIAVTSGLNIRFYAGAPLITSADGTHLGALCAMDQKPRQSLDSEQTRMLSVLAALAVRCIEIDLTDTKDRDQSEKDVVSR
jgi:diguanylate cyclase (GGDEF)-like protein